MHGIGGSFYEDPDKVVAKLNVGGEDLRLGARILEQRFCRDAA